MRDSVMSCLSIILMITVTVMIIVMITTTCVCNLLDMCL